jgi:hypothetical protein
VDAVVVSSSVSASSLLCTQQHRKSRRPHQETDEVVPYLTGPFDIRGSGRTLEALSLPVREEQSQPHIPLAIPAHEVMVGVERTALDWDSLCNRFERAAHTVIRQGELSW